MRTASRILLAAAAVGVAGALVARRPRARPPNLLLVTVDTLRADHLGAYGYPAGTSPAIDALAAGGTSFVTAIVPRGQTWPSLATILTSQFPVTHGVRRNGLRLPDDAPTLARVLRGAGYRCAAALANSGSADWPGFEVLERVRGDDARARDAAVAFLRSRGERPFFLWVHLFAPHRPYRPDDALVERFDPGYSGPIDGSVEQVKRISEEQVELAPRDLRQIVARYDGEVRTADRIVGDLVGTLEEEGLAGRTVVALTADHGEELYDRNRYLSHSASVYDSVLRAPLVLRWPGRLPAGRWVGGLAEAVDLGPTLLDLAGVRRPASFEGRSLVPAARGRAPAPSGPAFSELEDRVITVRTERYRYVDNPTDFDFPLSPDDPSALYPIDRQELYDHADDPGERANRVRQLPAEAARLRSAIDAWRRDHDWTAASDRLRGREVPDEAREALDALGYVR